MCPETFIGVAANRTLAWRFGQFFSWDSDLWSVGIGPARLECFDLALPPGVPVGLFLAFAEFTLLPADEFVAVGACLDHCLTQLDCRQIH